MPDHAGGGGERLHREPGRVGIGEVGQHQHRRRMFHEAVRHLLHRQPHVLEADLLADDVERRMREAVVHRAHHPSEHGAVADAGVEQAQGRRPGMDIVQLERDAVADHPFLAAGVHEQQIFLPVVEEAEVMLRIALAGWQLCGWGQRLAQALDDCGTGGRCPVHLHEAADAIECFGGDAAAVTQSRGELAVVDRAAAKGRFR